jgi:hypothetical protein
MKLSKIPKQIEGNLHRTADTVAEIPWNRTFAAASLVAGAVLLITGRRKTALAVAAVGTIVGVLEEPDAVRNLWDSIPGYIKTGQELLVKVESFVEQVAEQGDNLRKVLKRA